MRRYDSYKDSGVEWIGEIPSHWKNSKLKYSSEVTMGQSPSSEFYNDEGVGFPFLQGNSEFGIVHPTHKLTTTEITKKSKVNDILFSVRGSVGEINWSDKEYCIGRGLCSISPKKLELKLLWYLLIFSKDEFLSNSVGSTFVSVNTDDVKNLTIPIPPQSEQNQIVYYLDTKTSQIDSLIEKTQRKIELLKEKRTSLINEVVTKGLNPNVEMKDSGVEWIGEIPSHWEKNCVRYITEEHRQGYYSSESYTDKGLRVVRITDINDDKTISIENSPYYELNEVEEERFILKNGDYLFPRTGGVGRFGIVNNLTPSIYGSFLIRFRFNDKVLNQYLRYYFDSGIYLNQILSEIHGGVNQNVHVENIKDCKIFYPNKLEQQQIVSYLDEHTQLIDKTISVEQRRIELLKEYRQSLISEVVTGKRKVVV
jgi:type I restriction enzyme S subunit